MLDLPPCGGLPLLPHLQPAEHGLGRAIQQRDLRAGRAALAGLGHLEFATRRGNFSTTRSSEAQAVVGGSTWQLVLTRSQFLNVHLRQAAVGSLTCVRTCFLAWAGRSAHSGAYLASSCRFKPGCLMRAASLRAIARLCRICWRPVAAGESC